MSDEPSSLAMTISDALVQGEGMHLSQAQIATLTDYERTILNRTALRLNRRVRYSFDGGSVYIEKAPA